jgi:2-desacetyl-2-hydroxyethyl bacteriochlorophyllide A dehydrogenase
MGEENVAVVFSKPSTVVLEQRPMPQLNEGQVLIKTRKTLISTGTELTILSGEFPKDSIWEKYGVFPFQPGYDNIGIIVDVGEKVDRKLVGKRVATYCVHAKYVSSDKDMLRFVRDEVSDEEAAFFTIAEIVLNSVRRANVRLGESAVIYGAGLLGQLTAQVCRLCGARPVAVVDVSNKRLEMLPKDPVIVKVNPKEVDVEKTVFTCTRGRKADVVFEVTGNPGLIPSEFKVLRRQGRFVVLSSPRGPTLFDFHDLCNSPSFTIIGTHNSSHPPIETPDNPWTMMRHSELFFDLVVSGEINVKGLVTHQESYKKAPEIYDKLLKDRTQAMGVILDWTGMTHLKKH